MNYLATFLHCFARCSTLCIMVCVCVFSFSECTANKKVVRGASPNKGGRANTATNTSSADESNVSANTSSRLLVYNVRDYGAKGDGVTNDVKAFKAAIDAAVIAHKNVLIPAGVYVLKSYFPVYNTDITFLKDYNNITISGEGAKTIIKGIQANGMDVMQMNAIKNITIKDLCITSVITGTQPTQGSNGISITNGGYNIHFKNVTCYDLPIVVKEVYGDGGKAFTIQPVKTNNEVGEISFENGIIRNCLYGFGMDIDGAMYTNEQIGTIKFSQNQISNCYRGVSVGSSGSVDMLKMTTVVFPSISIQNNTFLGCQYGLFLARMTNLIITNNTIKGNKPFAINRSIGTKIPNEMVCIYARGLLNSKIDNNVVECLNCPSAVSIDAVGSDSGIKVPAYKNTFNNNTTKGVVVNKTVVTYTLPAPAQK
jgi:parallel beta-helix repeat protein